MISRSGFSLLAALVLSACGGASPFLAGATSTTTAGGTTTTTTIPATLSVNLNSSDLDLTDTANPVLSINISGLDGTGATNTFVRAAALDVTNTGGDNYLAYTLQSVSNRRQYLALFASGTAVTAGVVATEAEFNSQFGGGTYARIDSFSIPTTGEAEYTGTYAGLITHSPDGGTTDRAAITSGTIELNVDFSEPNIEGGVTGRTITDSVSAGSYFGGTSTLSDLVLKVTKPTDGVFAGDVFIGVEDVGAYGGVLGGVDASEVAGVLVFNPFPADTETFEYGTFVLPCTARTGSTCP